MDTDNFKDKSYRAHAEQYEQKGNPMGRIENKETIDYWRHDRMYRQFAPLMNNKDKWLTVGDGLGTDAHWLGNAGIEDVTASDIADSALKKAHELGHIQKFEQVNAEKIGFGDGHFDYVLCKEAYHHFPRPYIAVYEMLRVAKKGIIMIEPLDVGIEMPAIVFLKRVLDKFDNTLIDKFWKNRFSFETVGNFVYKVSEREFEKLGMGINLPVLAFKGFNDYYTTHLDLNQPTSNTKVFNKVKAKIRRKNFLSKLGITPYRLMVSVLFNEIPDEKTIAALKKDGYKLVYLPKNPYL